MTKDDTLAGLSAKFPDDEEWYNTKLVFNSVNANKIPISEGIIQQILREAHDENKRILKSNAWHIGDVLCTFDDYNPENYCGGSWSLVGQGLTLMGAGDDTFNPEGEYAHVLKLEEMPTHSHGVYAIEWYSSGACNGSNSSTAWRTAGWPPFKPIMKCEAKSGQGETDAVGLNQEHENMSPYFTVFIWEKVADDRA